MDSYQTIPYTVHWFDGSGMATAIVLRPGKTALCGARYEMNNYNQQLSAEHPWQITCLKCRKIMDERCKANNKGEI